MQIQKLIYILALGISVISCDKGKPLALPEISADFVKEYTIDLSGTLFFIGPELDSIHAQIIAECDCCASDLAFLSDSSFIYVERCLEGDGFVKGSYLAFDNYVFLRIDENTVSSSFGILDPETTYTETKQKESYIVYTLQDLKGKQLLHYTNGSYQEFGLRSDRSIDDFLEEFRDEKVLRKFLAE